MLEKRIENALTRKVEAAGGICWKWPASARAGVPDRIVVLNGKVVFVELKRPGGKLRPLQVQRHKELMAAGAEVLVVDSYEAVEGIIKLCLK